MSTAQASQIVSEHDYRSIGRNVAGTVTRPNDKQYDEARSVRNGLIDRRPSLIVECAGTSDVGQAVDFAREHALLLSVRATGHNVSGAAVNDGGVVIDLKQMRDVQVDLVTRTVRVGGGATWADVDRVTQQHGLATPGGLVSSTGVGGLTLHGGLGWLRRKYGLSLDNLVSVEIVTADGKVRTASEFEHPDLFWAVRGAGSNFGVVTSFVFRLHPVGPAVSLAATFYDLAEAHRLLPAWRDFTATVPDEVSSEAAFWSIPAVEDFPTELHGRPVLILFAAHCEPGGGGEQVLQPLRELGTPLLDLSATESYVDLQASFDPFFPKGWLYYWKSTYLDRFDDEAIAAMIELAATRPAPSALMALWHLGGAINRVARESTAFGRRDAPYLLSFDTTWTDPADTERGISWTRDAWATMQQFNAGGLYLNFAGFGEDQEALVRAGYGANFERLVAVKSRYDPANLFRSNLNIRPIPGTSGELAERR